MNSTTIAVDLAKSVFQLSVANERGHILERHSFTRRQFERFLGTQPQTEFILEACGTAHYWGRQLLAHGHTVAILPAQYVRPFVRRTKTDCHDADALIPARRCGEIPTVGVKSCEQQAVMALQAKLLHDDKVEMPEMSRECGRAILEEIADLENAIGVIELRLKEIAGQKPAQLLRTVPGIGVLTATATLASVASIHSFRSGRRFASWMGLTPREHSSGGRQRLGRITKNGDAYLRCLFTHGARSVLLCAKKRRTAKRSLTRLQTWALEVDARRGHNKTTIAVANKLARIVWAVWTQERPYQDYPKRETQ
jgi:transposase